MSRRVPCSTCRESGFVEVDGERQGCPECHGDGMVDAPRERSASYHPTIADTHRATALAALRIATEHAAAGRLGHARAFRGTAVSSIALLADARGWTEPRGEPRARVYASAATLPAYVAACAEVRA